MLQLIYALLTLVSTHSLFAVATQISLKTTIDAGPLLQTSAESGSAIVSYVQSIASCLSRQLRDSTGRIDWTMLLTIVH